MDYTIMLLLYACCQTFRRKYLDLHVTTWTYVVYIHVEFPCSSLLCFTIGTKKRHGLINM